MPRTPGRRPMTFTSFEQIMPDVDSLIERNHTTIGHWTLAQICRHLAGAFQMSTREIPFKAPWLLRKTLAPIFLRQLLRTGQMREGLKLPPAALPQPGLDARFEAETLRAAIHAYTAYTGPMSSHPFFDAIDRPTWDQIHLTHSAHHLSFARPNDSAP